MHDEILRKITSYNGVLIPGPVDPIDDVKKASSIGVFSHRSEEFSTLYNEIERLLRPIVGASSEKVILIPGSSTVGIEAVFLNVLDKKDRVLVVKQGFFGGWMENIVRRYSDNVDAIEAPFGSVVKKNDVIDKIKEGGYDVVGLVHYETSAGTAIRYLNEIGKAVREVGSLLIVDGVSSVGAESIRMSDWGIDSIITGPQKCLGAYPGVSIVIVNERVIDAMVSKEKGRSKPFYMDLLKYIEYKDKYGWTVTTPPINNIVGLYVSLKKIHEYGINRYFELHKNRAMEVYSFAEEKGIEPLVKNPSLRAYSVGVFRVNNAQDIVAKIKTSHGFIVSTGLGEYADKTVRIGMMGFTETNKIKRVVEALSMYA